MSKFNKKPKAPQGIAHLIVDDYAKNATEIEPISKGVNESKICALNEDIAHRDRKIEQQDDEISELKRRLSVHGKYQKQILKEVDAKRIICDQLRLQISLLTKSKEELEQAMAIINSKWHVRFFNFFKLKFWH